MSWYYMKMTQDMKDNPEPYYKHMVKKVTNSSGLTLESFKGKIRDYYSINHDRVVAAEIGSTRFYYGSLSWHKSNSYDIELTYIKKNLIGGKLL